MSDHGLLELTTLKRGVRVSEFFIAVHQAMWRGWAQGLDLVVMSPEAYSEVMRRHLAEVNPLSPAMHTFPRKVSTLGPLMYGEINHWSIAIDTRVGVQDGVMFCQNDYVNWPVIVEGKE